MKKKKVIIILSFIFLISIYLICSKNIFFMPKENVLDRVVINKSKNNMLAMYVSVGDTYEEYNGNTFPKNHTINTENSKCININGEVVPEVLSEEDGKIKVKTNKTVYCYVYFDIKEKECISSNSVLTQGTEYNDGVYTYKYKQQGTDATSWGNITDDGWGVMLTNKESTDPVTETPCTKIDNKPVVSTRYMFYNSKATSINLSGFNTSSVKDMSYMFKNATTTEITGYEYFDMRNVTTTASMFTNTNIATIDVSKYNIQNLKSTNSMFERAKATTINLENFDTSTVTTMISMFNGAKATTIIGLNKLNTSQVTAMQNMFRDTVIPTLDLSSFDTTNVTNTDDMFSGAKATTGYAKTQADADKFNQSSNKPEGLNFTVKGS